MRKRHLDNRNTHGKFKAQKKCSVLSSIIKLIMTSQYLTIPQMLQLSLLNKDLKHEVDQLHNWPADIYVSCFDFNCNVKQLMTKLTTVYGRKVFVNAIPRKFDVEGMELDICSKLNMNMSFENHTCIHDWLLESICDLPIQNLDLSHPRNILGDEGTIYLMPTLLVLKLGYARKLTNIALGRIATNCPNLRALSILCNCYITDKGIQNLLDKLPGLRYLNLTDCEEIKFNVTHFLPLESLNLSGTSANDQTLKGLKDANTITNLSLSRCRAITPEGIRTGISEMKQLEILDLGSTDLDIDSLAFLKHLTCLKELNLFNCWGLDDIDLKNLVNLIKHNCPMLRKLHLDYCSNLSRSEVEESGLIEIEDLEVSHEGLRSGMSDY